MTEEPGLLVKREKPLWLTVKRTECSDLLRCSPEDWPRLNSILSLAGQGDEEGQLEKMYKGEKEAEQEWLVS